MKVTIISESGDWKEMLYTKDIVSYDVKSQEILDFFIQLGDAYSNNDTLDDMFECLYNLINYGYLYTDDNIDDNYYDNFDYDDDYFDFDDELVSKDEYDDAWDDRIGYLGSSNWEEKGLTIINSETDEVIFLGKMS